MNIGAAVIIGFLSNHTEVTEFIDLVSLNKKEEKGLDLVDLLVD